MRDLSLRIKLNTIPCYIDCEYPKKYGLFISAYIFLNLQNIIYMAMKI